MNRFTLHTLSAAAVLALGFAGASSALAGFRPSYTPNTYQNQAASNAAAQNAANQHLANAAALNNLANSVNDATNQVLDQLKQQQQQQADQNQNSGSPSGSDSDNGNQ